MRRVLSAKFNCEKFFAHFEVYRSIWRFIAQTRLIAKSTY